MFLTFQNFQYKLKTEKGMDPFQAAFGIKNSSKQGKAGQGLRALPMC